MKTLLVEAASPLVAAQLNNYFAMTIRRAIATTNTRIHGVAISTIDFTPRSQGPWHHGEDAQPEE